MTDDEPSWIPRCDCKRAVLNQGDKCRVCVPEAEPVSEAPSGREPAQIAAIWERLEAATATDEHTKRVRYDHGGGRMYREAAGDRDLLVDCYNLGDREFYFSAVDDVRYLLSALRELAKSQAIIDKLADTISEQGAKLEAAAPLRTTAQHAVAMLQACRDVAPNEWEALMNTPAGSWLPSSLEDLRRAVEAALSSSPALPDHTKS